MSGKNSPCLSGHNTPSGKNSPNLTGKASPGSGKISPRISGHSNTTSPKANIEFFSSKIASKITAKPEPKTPKEVSRLSDIKEKEINNIVEENDVANGVTAETEEKQDKPAKQHTVEIGKAKECPNTCPKLVVIKSPKRTVLPKEDSSAPTEEISSQAKATIAKLDAMENEFLAKQLTETAAKNENQLNLDKEIESAAKIVCSDDSTEKIDDKVITAEDKESTSTESPIKSEDNFADVSNESSCKSPQNDDKCESKDDEKVSAEVVTTSSEVKDLNRDSKTTEVTEEKKDELSNGPKEAEAVKNVDIKEESKDTPSNEVKEIKKDVKNVTEKQLTRPAYSQAAAKPKSVTTPKPEPKSQARFIARSKTVVEMRPNTSQATPKRNDARNRNQTNKCSYPFNLTTGRTSLFDAPNKSNASNVSKKPVNRMQQMGSGDNKSTVKAEVHVRKRPPRPTTLKINEKGDKKENNNPALEKIKDCEEYGSSDTVVTQIDLSRIESSESLKTLVPEEGDVGNSVEVLNVDKTKSDDDGWLTVKSRRLSRESKKQSKSHWANRFHQPSATTSLPTLNMIESPKQETKELISSTKLDRAKSEQPQNIALDIPSTSRDIPKLPDFPAAHSSSNVQETVKPVEPIKAQETEIPKETEIPQETVKPKETPKTQDLPPPPPSKPTKPKEVSKPKTEAKDAKKDLAMIRQKSDVTGLKTRSSRSKALKKEKVKDTPKNDRSELTKNRLHSSLESLTTGLARSQESTQETFDFDSWKVEFKTNFNFLEDDDQIPNHNEILKSADPSEMSEIAEMTSQIEENERKISWALDFQSEVDQRKLSEQEDLLNRQIMELQQVSDIDLDTETDDTEVTIRFFFILYLNLYFVY